MTPLRRRLAAAALVLLVPTMAACGFDEQTDKVYQGATGVDNRAGSVYILNAAVVSATNGAGVFAGTLVDQVAADDALVSIGTAAGTNTVNVPLPSNKAVNFATSGQLKLTDPAIKAGGYVQVTLTFKNGHTTTLNVPVVANTGAYASVPVS